MKEIIRKKKMGIELSVDEINRFIRGVVDESIPDYQTSALLMAICFQGMSVRERSDLTQAMAQSGKCLNFSSAQKFIVDKHSTGGVGDKTSLILAPWLAACGAGVPMISGRGLGFTGGTLDKLDAIPGYQWAMTDIQMTDMIQNLGCFITGQTENLAPADKKIYALRDVTETVDEISLITASILSKKLSAGLNGLVMDVKCGSGAFMTDLKSARALANSIVETSREAKVKTQALITRMDFPLGLMVGNAMESEECRVFCQCEGIYIQAAHKIFLSKEALNDEESRIENLVVVTVELAIAMLRLASGTSRKLALQKLFAIWKSGELYNTFVKWIELQGGDLFRMAEKNKSIIDALKTSRSACIEMIAPQNGYLIRCNGRLLGELMVLLGAGRRVASDVIDDRVSLMMLKSYNQSVKKGESIARIYKPGLSTSDRQMAEVAGREIFGVSAKKGKKMAAILQAPA